MAERTSYDRLNMKIGQVVPEQMDDKAPVSPFLGATSGSVGTASIYYIHPEGRFYQVRFDIGHDAGIVETRYFSAEEIEEGRRRGIFRYPSTAISGPGQKRFHKINGFQRLEHLVGGKPENPYDISDDLDAEAGC